MDSKAEKYMKGLEEGFWFELLNGEASGAGATASLANSKGTPMLHPNVTGRVIVYKGKDQVGVLEDAHFSNIDMRIYDSEGDLHLAWEEYRGRKWSLRFETHDNRDKRGEAHTFEGMFLSPFQLGENGWIDWPHLLEMTQKEVGLAIELGALESRKDKFMPRFYGAGATAFCLCTSPNVTLEEIRPYISFLNFTQFWDEQIDNPVVLGRRLTFGEICEIRDRYMEVLLGRKEPDEQEVSFDFPMLKPICRYMKIFREAVVDRTPDYEVAQRCFVDWLEYLNSNALAQCAEMYEFEKTCETGTIAIAKDEARFFDVGVYITLSMQLHSYRKKVPFEIHHDHLYNLCKRKTSENMTSVNDIMSCRKDYYLGDHNNVVLTRHLCKNMGYLEAFNEILDFANGATLDLVETEKYLLRLYRDSKDLVELKDALFLQKSMLLGHAQWYAFLQRYHQRVTYDLVIHLEDESWKECAFKKVPKLK